LYRYAAGVTIDAGLRGSSLLNGMLSRQGLFAVSMRGEGNAVVHGIGGLMEHALGVGLDTTFHHVILHWSKHCSIDDSQCGGPSPRTVPPPSDLLRPKRVPPGCCPPNA
jgi:hypothetical protein